MVYKTKGVCSQLINVEVENNIVTSVEFVGGCNGNTQGVAALVEGMDAVSYTHLDVYKRQVLDRSVTQSPYAKTKNMAEKVRTDTYRPCLYNTHSSLPS